MITTTSAVTTVAREHDKAITKTMEEFNKPPLGLGYLDCIDFVKPLIFIGIIGTKKPRI